MPLYPYQTLPNDWELFNAEQAQQSLPEYLKSFYYQPLVGASQQMQPTDFVAVDIETTGLDAQQDDTWKHGVQPVT